jgi:hypothetical protein
MGALRGRSPCHQKKTLILKVLILTLKSIAAGLISASIGSFAINQLHFFIVMYLYFRTQKSPHTTNILIGRDECSNYFIPNFPLRLGCLKKPLLKKGSPNSLISLDNVGDNKGSF